MDISKILLVDDDLTVNYFHKRLLQSFFDKDKIETCLNGKQAIDMLTNMKETNDKEDHVIILLDLNMPVMNGWEFLAEFHYLKEELKFSSTIYIVTSSLNPEDKNNCISNTDVKKYLNKPMSKKDIELILS
jgi:CheY-like chemotaxis protein